MAVDDVRLFMSYRRSDSAGYAGRVFEGLESRLGPEHIFKDLTSIGPGENYLDAISDGISRATAVLLIVGPDWLSPRIFDEHDPVRFEVGEALRQGKRLVPVLVGNSAMPDAESLPIDLRPLVLQNAIELTNAGWGQDLDRLCAKLVGEPARQNRTSTFQWMAAGWAVLSLVVAGDTISAHGLTHRGILSLLVIAVLCFGVGIWSSRSRHRGSSLLGWAGVAFALILAAASF